MIGGGVRPGVAGPQDPAQRLTFRLLSFIPFGLHFLFVWIPLMKAQERPLLAETPFA